MQNIKENLHKQQMPKIERFLLAENPILSDDPRAGLYIIHTRPPVMICEVFHFEPGEETRYINCKNQFNVGASVDYPGELICIGCLWMAPTDKSADDLAKIMRRMGDWYHAYLVWEDGRDY